MMLCTMICYRQEAHHGRSFHPEASTTLYFVQNQPSIDAYFIQDDYCSDVHSILDSFILDVTFERGARAAVKDSC